MNGCSAGGEYCAACMTQCTRCYSVVCSVHKHSHDAPCKDECEFTAVMENKGGYNNIYEYIVLMIGWVYELSYDRRAL